MCSATFYGFRSEWTKGAMISFTKLRCLTCRLDSSLFELGKRLQLLQKMTVPVYGDRRHTYTTLNSKASDAYRNLAEEQAEKKHCVVEMCVHFALRNSGSNFRGKQRLGYELKSCSYFKQGMPRGAEASFRTEK